MKLNGKQIDPRLEALLDEALGPASVPGGVPVDLAQRIITHTQGRLHRGIAGRISPIWLPALRAMAAAVVLAAGIAVVVVSGSIVNQARNIVVVRGGLEQLAQSRPNALDQDLAMLAMQLEVAAAERQMSAAWTDNGGDWRNLELDLQTLSGGATF